MRSLWLSQVWVGVWWRKIQVNPGDRIRFTYHIKYFSEAQVARSQDASSLPTGIILVQSQSLMPSSSIRGQSDWRRLQPRDVLSRDMSSGCSSLPPTLTTTSLQLRNLQDSSTGAWPTDSTPPFRGLTECLKRFHSAKFYLFDGKLTRNLLHQQQT